MRFLLRTALMFGGLSLLLVVSDAHAGDPFSFSGNWNYRENGGDEVETAESFNQSYNLSFIKQLSAAMSMTAATRYNQNDLSEGNDSSSLNPSASFDLRNDLFAFNLSGSQSRFESDGSPDFINKTWGANLYSQLEKWPSLRLSYNQSSSQDDLSPHEQDSESTNLSASVEYSLSSFDMLYDFSRGTSDDLVGDSTSETMNHYAQLKFSESFFRNRLSVSATQQYSSNETETDTRVGVDGVFVTPVTILAGFSSIDNTPLSGALNANDALKDGDRVTPAVIWSGQSNDVLNVGIQVNFQLVSQLSIYFDQFLPVGEQSKLSWELYQSADNNTWEKVNQVPTVDMDTVSTRTRATIDVPVQIVARYLKVVVRANTNLIDPLGVTEIEAGELRTTDASRVVTTTKFVSHQSQFNVTYRLAPGWSTGYSMRRVVNLPDQGPDNTQMTHTVNASYSPNQYFSMVAGASENTDDTDGSDETRTRSYSLAFNSSPLPTLDLSLGYTRTHNYEAGDETSQNDQVNGTLTAELYPDLTVGFSPSWSRSEETDEGDQTTTYGFILTSSARLNPRTNVTAYWNYSKTTQDTTDDEEDSDEAPSKQYGATLSYRPSDVLLASGSLQRNEDTDSTTLSGNMAWLFTRRVQANFGASFDLGDEDTEQYSTSVHWSISRNLSLQGTGSYQVASSGDTWNMGFGLNANY